MKALTFVFAGLMFVCGAVVAQDELANAYNELKAASDAKKGPAEIKKAAEATFAAVKKNSGPAPADVDKESWDARVKYAQDVQVQAEYAVYAAATAAAPAQAVDLFSFLEANAPKSKYMAMGYTRYLQALQQSGQTARIAAVADKAAAANPENFQVLMAAADGAFSRQQADAALNYARRASAILDKHPKAPEGVAAAEWDKTVSQATGRAHYYAGVVYASKQQWAQADKELTPALPLVKFDGAMTSIATYYLGEAKYALGRQTMDRATINQGMKYVEQAATMTGQYRDVAAQRLRVMKQEMGIK